MKKLYFVRHGLSEMNVSGHWAGTSETPLTTEGRKQAKLAGKKAKKLNIDYIVSSPLKRAHETAKIIAEEIGYPIDQIYINPLFVERHWGKLEGAKWSPDIDLDGISDIETVDTIVERGKLALDFLKTLDANNILVVSHGSFGRAIRHHLIEEYPYSSLGTEKTKIPNAKIVCWI